MNFTRRRLFTLAAPVIVAGGGYGRFFEPGWLVETEKNVKIGGRLPGRPLRILHLSDLHASAVVPLSFLLNSFQMGAAAKPDIICLTGDFVTTSEDFDHELYRQHLAWLASVAPTFAVLGNHDGGAWAARLGLPNSRLVASLLLRSGIELLHNRSKDITVGGSTVRLIGIGDYWSNQSDGAAAYQTVPNTAADLTLALNHNPDAKLEFRDRHWDLMLCGHTHGGQVKIPLFGAPYPNVRDRRYCEGLVPYGQGMVHITRGVGNVDGLRFNCRPEVSMLVVA